MRPFVQYGPYVAIDFETSAYSGACACAIGLARMENFGVAETWYSLIRPESPLIRFTHVHGLTWDDLEDAPVFADIWPQIAAFIADAKFLIAHNAGFDSRVLASCCAAFGIRKPQKQFLCTLRGSRRGLALPRYGLGVVCSHLGIALEHHHAGSDAEACGRLHARLHELGVTDEQMRLNGSGVGNG